jgi:hypothetical protein
MHTTYHTSTPTLTPLLYRQCIRWTHQQCRPTPSCPSLFYPTKRCAIHPSITEYPKTIQVQIYNKNDLRNIIASHDECFIGSTLCYPYYSSRSVVLAPTAVPPTKTWRPPYVPRAGLDVYHNALGVALARSVWTETRNATLALKTSGAPPGQGIALRVLRRRDLHRGATS